MSTFGDRTRFATLLAVGAILIAAGLFIRLSGITPLLLGQTTNVGTMTTFLNGNSDDAVLQVSQSGSGSAVRGTTGGGSGIAGYFSSANGTGVLGIAGGGDEAGISAANEARMTGSGSALLADGGENLGVIATSDRSTAVFAATTGRGRAGVHAIDRSPDGSGFALLAAGDTTITGSLSVSDGCVGCTPMALAVNGTSGPVRQGQAVTVIGLQVAPDGSTIVVVRPAGPPDPVIGIVDRGLVLAAAGDERTRLPAKWLDGMPEVPAGGTMRVAIAGLLTLDGELAGVAAGDALAVGPEGGDLVPLQDGSSSVGRYLGVRPDGRGVIAIAIDPAG